MKEIHFILRNVVPRQGTETFHFCFSKIIFIIEKCSSPTGDGNSVNVHCFRDLFCTLRNVVPRQGTETSCCDVVSRQLLLRNVVPRQGTETISEISVGSFLHIEKCSSPTGDGNSRNASSVKMSFSLRNVVPRQGTETVVQNVEIPFQMIEKCSSPTGDGNVPSIHATKASYH